MSSENSSLDAMMSVCYAIPGRQQGNWLMCITEVLVAFQCQNIRYCFSTVNVEMLFHFQEIQSQHAIDFTTSLNDLTLQLLAMFDVYLTKKDIQQGRM